MRVRFSGLLFTTLIVLDFLSALNSIEIVVENLMNTNPDIGATEADRTRGDVGVIKNIKKNRNDRKVSKGKDQTLHVRYGTNIFMTEDDKARILSILLETFQFLVLLGSNTLALLGVIRSQASLLVPWLCIYLIGVCRWANIISLADGF